MNQPAVGDIVSARDWHGDIITVRLREFIDSEAHGPGFKATEVTDGRFVALPMSHIIKTAQVENIGWGKWNLNHPDGTTERLGSKKAALERAEELGYIVTEV